MTWANSLARSKDYAARVVYASPRSPACIFGAKSFKIDQEFAEMG